MLATAVLISKSQVEPITLEEARTHLRVDLWGSPAVSDDDDWINAQIPAARGYCESFTGLSLIQKVWEAVADTFPPYGCRWSDVFLELPYGPVVAAVPIVVTYADATDGTVTTWPDTEYALDLYATPARLKLAYGKSWPSVRCQANAVKVRYTAGYDIAGTSPEVNPLPAEIRSAILLTLGHLYKNRESVINGVQPFELPLGVQALLQPYRVNMGV